MTSQNGATVGPKCDLVYVTDAAPGLRRIRSDAGFDYLLPDGQLLTDRAELDRIARLAIPPAYEEVWICTDLRGHLQATGRDVRGRKQYRYHSEWRRLRDREKFERMPAFGEALPRLRRRLRRDLILSGLPREKVLAVVVSLLDMTRARIGNAEYARENDSYGLTTLRNRHVRFAREGSVLLQFRGKGGAEHRIDINDRQLTRLVRHCHQLPGQRLFQYVDESGELRPIDSGQVNQYLKETMGEAFTAKDFRTWGATLRAIAILHATPLPEPASERALASSILEAIRQVAAELRNTPAVCRKSYINPLVFEAWRTGTLHRQIGERIGNAPRRAERLIPAFLRRQARASNRARDTSAAQRPGKTVSYASNALFRRAIRNVADRRAHCPRGR
jgi:DNA topoisomerase-1